MAGAQEQTLAAQIVTAPSDRGRVVVRVTPKEGTGDQVTMDLVSDLRSGLADAAPSALVGGPAAQNYDLTDILTLQSEIARGIATDERTTGGPVIVKIDEKLGLTKEKYRTAVILRPRREARGAQ